MALGVLRIGSVQNRQFKQWRRFLRQPEREEHPWVALEGWKNLADVPLPIQVLLYERRVAADTRLLELQKRALRKVELEPPLMRRLSLLRKPQGVVGFVEKPTWDWSDLPPFVIYLQGLQDPGNLGTLIRTAHATGFGVVSSPGTVSFFNAKVVRASAASLFSVPFLSGVTPEELRERGYSLWAARAEQGQSVFQLEFPSRLALLVGNEGHGLSPSLLRQVEKSVRIPLRPGAPSLNAAVAGSLLMYEVFRRRS